MSVHYNSFKGKYTVRVRRNGRKTQVAAFWTEEEAIAYDSQIEQDDNSVRPYSPEWFRQESKSQITRLTLKYNSPPSPVEVSDCV